MELIVEDLEALRKHLGHKEWFILGHSFGGYIAQLYALRFPSSVSYLILSSTGPGRYALGNQEGRHLIANRITPKIEDALSRRDTMSSDEEWKEIWHAILPLYFYDNGLRQFLAEDKTVYRHRLALHGSRVLLPTIDTRSQLHLLHMPTLIVHGQYDWIIPTRHAQILYKGIPGSELVIFNGCGHFPFVEKQGKFIRLLAGLVGDF